MKRTLAALTDAAGAAAREAGQLLRSRPKEVLHKGSIDLVTEIDLASERCIRAALAHTGIPVQGEEDGGPADGERWVVDPLDGTTNFVHGYPAYCVSIALVRGTRPVVGAIYDPIHDALFAGHARGGAHRNAVPLRVSDCRSLEQALCVTGFPYNRRDAMRFYLRYVERALSACQGVRRSGSAAMDMATLAAGQCDIFWEFGLKAWDTAAGQLLVAEAGGVVSRLSGQTHVPGAPHVLATNPWLHEAMVHLFADLPRTPPATAGNGDRMKSLQDALRDALPPAASPASAAPLAAREPAAPVGVATLPRPAGTPWAEQLALHGVRPDRDAPIGQWIQKTAGILKQLEANGRKHDVRALKQARDEFVKSREKKAWEAVKARFEELELPEKAYRALKQEGADVEKVLAKLYTRKAEQWRGIASNRVRDELLGT